MTNAERERGKDKKPEGKLTDNNQGLRKGRERESKMNRRVRSFKGLRGDVSRERLRTDEQSPE